MGFVAILENDIVKDVVKSDIIDDTHIKINEISYAVIKSALQDGFEIKTPDTNSIEYQNLYYYKNNNIEPITVYLINIYNSNDKLLITGLSKKMSNEIFDTTIYRFVTKEVYNYIESRPELMQNKKFYIDSNLEIVTSIDQVLSLDDKTEEEEKENTKNYVIGEARQLLVERFDVGIMIDFFTFILMNNELASRGFFITESNREDKYLEIVNTDDESLLDKLSDYLKALDNLHRYKQYFVLFKNFEDKLQSDEISPEEMKTELEKFKKEFV